MFRFRGHLGRKRFALAAAIRVGLFAASVLGFPFFLYAVGMLTSCRGVGGACGAVALMTSASIKPLLAILFVFSFFGICLRRARDAGIPAWLGLVVPLLLTTDAGFLLFAGAHWSFAFSAGVLRGSFPFHLLLALACMVALALLAPRDTAPSDRNPFGRAGQATAVLATVVSAFALLKMATMIPLWGRAMLPFLVAAQPVLLVQPYVMIGFVAALAWCVWLSLHSPAPVPISRAIVPPFVHRRAMITLLVLAIALAIGAFMAGIQGGGPLWAVVLRPDMFLPTAGLYFALLTAGYLAVVVPSRRSFAFLALTVLPFLQYGYARWATVQEQARELAEIAAIPTVRVAQLPDTIVMQTGRLAQPEIVLGIPGIARVIAGELQRPGARLIQYEQGEAKAARRTDVAGLPPRHLQLRVGAASSFAKRNQAFAGSDGGPFELRLIEPGRDDLIAVWYRRFNPLPSFPPIITQSGWYRGPNIAGSSEAPAALRQFIAKALAPAS